MESYLLIGISILVLLIYVVNCVINYCKQFNQQNLKIINLCLERKLVNQLLNIISHSSKIDNTLNEIIELIKSYYQLEEVVIYSLSSNSIISKVNDKNLYLDKMIEEYVNKNLNKILVNLSKSEIFSVKLDSKFKMFVMCLNNKEKAGDFFFIFIEGNVKLTTHEFETITYSIKPIICFAYNNIH